MYNSYDTSSFLSGLDSINSASNTAQGVMIWTIVASIIAIVGSILIYFLFIKSKTEFKGGLKTLQDYLSGAKVHIEAIVKMFYYAGLILVILTSINSLILIGTVYDAGTGIIQFLTSLLLGPIVVRLAFEFAMLLIRIWKNTENLNKK